MAGINGNLLAPLVNDGGVLGSVYNKQKLSNILKINSEDEIDVDYINSVLSKIQSNNRFIETPRINGFFFGFDRKIIKYELEDGNLFNPQNINVGNEDELCRRLTKASYPIYVDLNTYVYHYKGISFNKNYKDRNKI